MRVTIRIITLTLMTTAALAVMGPAQAGGGGGGGGACAAFASGSSGAIALQDFCFEPVSATAEPGTSLTVTNEGDQPHTYTALDGSFDTGTLAPGESATVTIPETAGTLPVYCVLHADRAGNGMAGTLTVTGATAEPVAATTSSSGPGSAGIALAGGFVLGTAAMVAIRRRDERTEHEREHVEMSS